MAEGLGYGKDMETLGEVVVKNLLFITNPGYKAVNI